MSKPPRGQELTNQALIDRYVNWLDKERGRTAATLKSYRRVTTAFAKWRHWHGLLQRDVRDMGMFVTRPKDAGGERAPATIAQEVNILRAFYQWAWEQGWTDHHMARALHGPTVPHRDPKPIPDGDWMRIWSQDMDARTRTILGLAYFCGLRRYELWHLQVDQLGDNAVEDFIRKGGGEHSHRWDQVLDVYERAVTLKPLLIDRRLLTDSIAAVRTDSYRWLFPTRHRSATNINGFNHWWGRQMPSGVTVTPHQARHSCATNLIRAGLPAPLVMRYMNHTSMEVTMRYVRAAGSDFDEWLHKEGP